MALKLRFMDDNGPVEAFWVDYEEGMQIEIVPLPRSKQRELRKKHTRKQQLWKSGSLLTEDVFDDEAYEREAAIIMIRNWRELENRDGRPIPCTDATKPVVLDYDTKMAAFVLAHAMNLQSALDKQEAELTENLGDTSGGSGTKKQTVKPVLSDDN